MEKVKSVVSSENRQMLGTKIVELDTFLGFAFRLLFLLQPSLLLSFFPARVAGVLLCATG
jgi:hypothetical protein